MGIIREPEGVDFIISSKPYTNAEREKISAYIAAYKAKHKKLWQVLKAVKKQQ
ncbi:MAG: hypothetical protein ACOYMA_13885 [Bacteroidia bacterium]